LSVRAAAEKLIAAGLQVVPLAAGAKACKDSDWMELVFQPDDFDPDDNIGIRSVEGIVDADLDCAEAVAVAPKFFPPTGLVYGREGKRGAHRVYRCVGIEKTIALKDSVSPDSSGTMAELRVNHQSMAPPSVHPDGKLLEWEDQGELTGTIAEVVPDQLIRALRLTCTAALIARHYNPPKNRHDWWMGLSGFLRSLGVTRAECEAVCGESTRVAGDKDVVDRLAVVRGTYDKADGDQVKGPGVVVDLMANGKGFAACLRKIWGQAGGTKDGAAGMPKDALEKLNEHHAVLFQQSGDLVVITEDSEEGRPFLRYSSLQTIRDLYPEQVIVGFDRRNDPLMKKLGQAWLDSPQRRFYRGIEMRPGGNTTDGYYNLWRGFSVEPKAGDWSLYRAHIKDVICDGVEDHARYVISWMAQAVQEPGRPAKTAIALRGGQGTGKSTFAKWFGALFGSHYLHLDSTRHLTGNFNAHLHNAILVFADEAAWPGNKAGLGALRRMVTEETLQIERKGMDVMTVPNVIHMILASNEQWVVPAAMDERRFAVFDVGLSRQNDKAYFGAIRKQLFEDGGLAAMLHDLLAHDVGDSLKTLPVTKALLDQKQITSSPQEQWWYEVLQDGTFWRPDREHGGECLIDRDELYEAYIKTMDQARTSTTYTPHGFKTQLGMFLGRVLPSGYPKTRRVSIGGLRRWTWALPLLPAARRHYEVMHRMPAGLVWPVEDEGSGGPTIGDAEDKF
jgi:hypothetical protein